VKIMGFNEMAKSFDTFDIGLIKWATAAVVLLIAKYWTALISFDWYWYVIAFVVFSIRPLMHMFRK